MLVFPDAELETRRYLLRVLGPRWPGLQVVPQQPAEGTDWQLDKPTMIVLTVGGTGQRTGRVYEQVLIGTQVYAPTHSQASLLAIEIRAFLGHWPQTSGMVAGHSDNARPTRATPDDVAYPSYWYAANIQFKATSLTL